MMDRQHNKEKKDRGTMIHAGFIVRNLKRDEMYNYIMDKLSNNESISVRRELGTFCYIPRGFFANYNKTEYESDLFAIDEFLRVFYSDEFPSNESSKVDAVHYPKGYYRAEMNPGTRYVQLVKQKPISGYKLCTGHYPINVINDSENIEVIEHIYKMIAKSDENSVAKFNAKADKLIDELREELRKYQSYTSDLYYDYDTYLINTFNEFMQGYHNSVEIRKL